MLAKAADILFNLTCANRLATGVELLSRNDIDVILLGLLLPDSKGLSTFVKVHKQAGEVPIVVLTDLGNEAIALESVRMGAQDYLVKGHMNTDLLVRSIRYSIERKKGEVELRKLNETNRRTVVMVAHDLRSPLTAIQGCAELLHDGDIGTVSTTQQEMLGTIIRNTQQLSLLVNTFLDFEQIRAQTLHLDRDYFSLEGMLSAVAEEFKPDALARGLELRTDLGSSLLVYGGREQLARVFHNLLSNAIKFSDTGVITLRAWKEKNLVLVDVIDQGHGIPKEELPHIFEKFYRARHLDSSNPKEGIGLGLTIAQTIVEEHGPIAPERRKHSGSH
jgi:signal transduction histidine kinase